MSNRLTLEELAELDRLLDKATPGKWKTWGLDVMADTGGDSDVSKATLVARGAGPRTFNIDLICTMQRNIAALIQEAREYRRLTSALDFLCEQDAMVQVPQGDDMACSCPESASVWT